MKTIFISFAYLLLCSFLFSCGKSEKKDPFEFKYEIIQIEGCEYLRYMGAQGYKHVTHKGNCNNTIHYYNK